MVSMYNKSRFVSCSASAYMAHFHVKSTQICFVNEDRNFRYTSRYKGSWVDRPALTLDIVFAIAYQGLIRSNPCQLEGRTIPTLQCAPPNQLCQPSSEGSREREHAAHSLRRYSHSWFVVYTTLHFKCSAPTHSCQRRYALAQPSCHNGK